MILVVAEHGNGKLNRATWEAIAAAQQVPGFRLAKQSRIELRGDHYHLEGQVELEQGTQKFYADVVDYYHDHTPRGPAGWAVKRSRPGSARRRCWPSSSTTAPWPR